MEPVLTKRAAMGNDELPNVAKLRELKPPAAQAEEPARAQPLLIEYSSTQVVADALARLQRTQGVARGDRSELSEAFKMLRNQVRQRMQPDGLNLLAITSPRSIEGKSLSAVNLALALAADYDTSVLLVDADLNGNGLQKIFGLDDAKGLSDHLLHGAEIPELLINPGVPRLVFLPAGRAVLNSAELLSTKAAHRLLQEMKQRYQDRYLIVDLPPLLDTADALAFLPLVDTTLLVIEEDKTTLRDIEQAAELLAPFNLMGTVLSKGRGADDPAPAPRKARWYET
jgi:protein-tyrosine kinase